MGPALCHGNWENMTQPLGTTKTHGPLGTTKTHGNWENMMKAHDPCPFQSQKDPGSSPTTQTREAESATNAQGQDPPQPPPVDPNREVLPTNLMLELIQGLQQTQGELAEAIKQLKEKDADLVKQEREKNPKEPRHFVRRPPYPTELLKQPYLEKYIVPTFSRFDDRKGSALVHISKAYTWYTTLPPGSIKTWEDMVELFCGKYFQAEEKITLVNLHITKQIAGLFEGNSMRRFKMEPWNSLKHSKRGNPVIPCGFGHMGPNEDVRDLSGGDCDAPKSDKYEDMDVQYPDHRRPLYLLATINEVQVRRALVDNWFLYQPHSLKHSPKQYKSPQKKIQGAPMEIKGFGGIGEYTKGAHSTYSKGWSYCRLSHGSMLWIPWFPTTYLLGKALAAQALGEASLAKLVGIPLPKWEEIRDALDGRFERSVGTEKGSAGKKLVPARVSRSVSASVYRIGRTIYPLMKIQLQGNLLKQIPKFLQKKNLRDAEKTAFRTPIGNFYYIRHAIWTSRMPEPHIKEP
uniref:Retrotransposon gag domain-containing protein n=1 Tax=Fagus sylvatica TaxID=28930 RepID=A0A2N9IF38_FAGSY